jgi:hypothetical protein
LYRAYVGVIQAQAPFAQEKQEKRILEHSQNPLRVGFNACQLPYALFQKKARAPAHAEFQSLASLWHPPAKAGDFSIRHHGPLRAMGMVNKNVFAHFFFSTIENYSHFS